ncbi:MAG: prepilin-type N-terminal cleavage/methylation domain-containing protein [Marinagarivorans sp.]
MLKTHCLQRGFSLIELLVAIAIVGILAAIAVPNYSKFILRGEADAAYGDLQALSLALEGRFRRILSYPATAATTTSAVKELVTSWGPSSKPATFGFEYKLVDQASGKYQVSAVGQTTGKFKECTLILEVLRGAATRYCDEPTKCPVTCTKLPAAAQ